MRRQVVLDADTYVDGVLAGDRALLARAITLVESTVPAHEALAQEVLLRVLSRTGNATRLGISGVPGVGKSTFIESFGWMLLEEGHRVAVLAIDPSSARTGGSILGDKTRMAKLSMDARAFIRPSPTAGSLGGVARHTREAMLLCEAAGFDVVVVETVGVGQSETAVAGMVDFFLVLMLATAGDELQGIKRGILELADAVAVNKCDEERPEVVTRALGDYGAALRIVRGHDAVWTPRVLKCSGLGGQGLPELWALVKEHRIHMERSGLLAKKRAQQAIRWTWDLVEDTLLGSLYSSAAVRAAREGLEADVAAGRVTPTLAAKRLLEVFSAPGSSEA
ncbi:MAG: methylmalonyl Co-A mutase-associated GTPase MeaB [Silvanigrellales bacterium]|nr:methylmalonyl Co-A mutase-associated GTPase MeaB [Silvanigrellales bacterium]